MNGRRKGRKEGWREGDDPMGGNWERTSAADQLDKAEFGDGERRGRDETQVEEKNGIIPACFWWLFFFGCVVVSSPRVFLVFLLLLHKLWAALLSVTLRMRRINPPP
jgi:hypothetical protein